MKQKAWEAKSFYDHKIGEVLEEKEGVEGRLEEVERKKAEVEEELKSTQLVVMNMEAESDHHRSRFDKVLAEIKERDAKIERARLELEKLRRGAAGVQEERRRT
eukprot:CAMPEP_0197564844 /NCGR_PEP_ID=MMETSP1320-20131121/31102_1 /TAXON_ID=91990 /ORGANISM="Bolidomonas sp., Strain RCC2347" /LENGTH=103 /DNA_ID=CAMNT_0043126783 /DNA_START=1065 /DNA_END=1373 /DNA_ORIENTATION=+